MWWHRAARFVRTVRHLRLRQVGALAARRVRGVRLVRLDGGDREPVPRCRWPAGAAFPAASGAHDPASVLAGDLTFQNRREAVGFPPDWNRTDLPRLWRYHLHYHEFLQALPFERARDAALDRRKRRQSSARCLAGASRLNREMRYRAVGHRMPLDLRPCDPLDILQNESAVGERESITKKLVGAFYPLAIHEHRFEQLCTLVL